MTTSRHKRLAFVRLCVAALGLAACCAAPSARAATLTWGTTGTGGSGTWNTTLTNWWTGAAQTTWSNAAPDDAVLAGTAGTLKAMRRMSPPQAGHASGTFSAIFAMSWAQATREVSWERGCSLRRAPSPRTSPGWRGRDAAASARVPRLPIASAVTAGLSGWFGAKTPW